MEKKSIIKRVKNVWKAIWHHVKAWMGAFVMLLCMVSGVMVPWLYMGKMADAILEIWNEGNLLYIPDLLKILVTVAGIIIFPIVAVICAIIITGTIGYIVYKLYAFIKKDKYALRDILDELVYNGLLK